jgi:PAS domain S-box-containing protein
MKDELEIVNRNALRLLRLVNSLLDFSRIEAGRHKALFQPTDLAAFSADLASVFRSACEKAGLRLNIDCPSLSQPVFVDREMWEKIVLNLLSNAFKFTFEGEIAVSLRQSGNNVQLRVRDTGSGIPAAEMPRLFERFHRIENAKSRTNEGSGIGLALVQELVKLHGGSISAESEPGRGTTFIVSIPLGSKHLPNDQLGEADEVTATAAWATAYIEEALCWLPEKLPEIRQQAAVEGPFFRSEDGAAAGKQRILVADDNADMRQYIERLLSDQYDVQTVPDGEAALAAIRARAPDLLLTDAMMPKLDGFGLLQQLRADPGTSALPVIMLSARAGEESRVEGMAGGADDYLVKPFSARELVVRVAARLQMAHLRREAGETLRQSHARFEALVNSAPIGIFPVDANLRIRQVNPKARPFFGDTKELIGSDFEKVMRSLWAPDLAGEFVNRVRDTLKSGTPYFVPEFSGQRLDRSGIEYYECEFHRIWLPDGSCGVVCYFSDISRHVLVRQALAENEQWMRNNQRKLRLVADHAPVLIAHCDSDGRYKFVNKPYAASFGLHPKDVVGKCIEEVVGESTYARFKEHVEKALSGEPTEFEVEIPFKVGGTQFVRCGYTPEWDGGTVVGFVAAITNITDRKRAEEGLREADRKKSEFIATLAHELRNPLAPISSGLRVMRTTGGNHEKTQQMMERQVQHMVRLVDDLMDVSRISQGKLTLQKERIDLAAVLNSAVETSRPDIEKAGQQLSLQLPPQPIIVEADAVRLSQVFTNLLNNAAKYSDRHGLIRLAVKLQGSSAVVSVRDEGIGIAGDQLPHIFKMFSQVDRSIERSRGGLGIGLSLVSRLVDMHGGTIEAHSEGLGKGSEFIVKLPILAGASPAQPKPSRDYASMKSSLRVLVVDDNRDSADTLAMVLQLSGNETQVSYDGEQALRAYDTFRPDVMLLDIGMPTLSGHEICRRIRSKPCGKNVVMIAQTGWGQDEDRKMTHEAGFDHHMTKPVSTDTIMKILTGLKK